MVAILDVVVAWGLYIFFQPVNRSLSLLAALFRVVYATMLGIALTNLLSALRLSGGADSLKAFGADQLQAQMMVLLGAFQSAWDLSLIIFGLHLFILGIVNGHRDNAGALEHRADLSFLQLGVALAVAQPVWPGHGRP